MRFLEKHWPSLLGVSMSALYIYLQLLQWQKHGDDFRLIAVNVIVTVGLWIVLLVAIAKYWKLSKSQQSTHSEDHLPEIERSVFVCANGYPLQALQSALALHVQVLSTVKTKIVYAKATLSRVDGYRGKTSQIDLESSEPHIIPARQMFHLVLIKKEMAQDEVRRFLAPNVAIEGIIKLEENNTYLPQPFQLMTHRECPEDRQPQVASLRDTAIRLFDRLGTFEQEYEKKSQIQPEPGESGEDFVTRRLDKALQQNTQMAADFRIQFENEMRSLNNQLQVRSGVCYSLTAGIDKATRTCNAKMIKEMREHLWECARTMEPT